ncbi:MAG TPA: 16S rRNA (uracil(1498)-N(3))-methyltransferase [Firmicutes bacterium]|nr:16S rRNA (uracil(1498)-N(3))-methyltransferase [Bacillota bacterium]
MPRFFQDFPGGEAARVTGQDAVHIRRALRMKPGENLTLCDGRGNDYFCEVAGFEGEDVLLKVLYRTPTACEPSVAVTLYQGLPKGEKMEWILQKAVELGVSAVVPVAMARSVVRLEGKEERRRARWQKIADEAAGQSGRGILPAVEAPHTWRRAMERLQADGAPVIAFYEGGGQPLARLVERGARRLAVFVGPEGGFEPAEIGELQALGAQVATLGPRILRCETAPLAALSVIMALTGNME